MSDTGEGAGAVADPTDAGLPATKRGLDALVETYSQAAGALPQTFLASVPSAIAQLALFVITVVVVILLVVSPLTLLAGPGGLVVILGLVVLLAVVAALGSVTLAVLHQAQLRAAWRHADEGVSVGIVDGIRGGFTDVRLNAFLAVWFAAQALATLVFVLPGVALEAAFAAVAPAVVVDGLPLRRAIAESLADFRAAPVARIGVSLADFVVTWGIMGVLPVIGTFVAVPLSVQLHLRSYLEHSRRQPVDDV